MFQNKSWEKCRLSDYRRRKACDLSSRSFCLPYSTVRLLFLAYFILFSIPLCASAGNNNQHPNNDSEKPWHIIADEIHYDDKAKQYIGKGNVVITKGDQKLTADFIRFDHKNMKVNAKGHVIMQIGEDTLSGTSIEMDLKSEIGTVYDGTIFMKENHFYIKGNKIQKVGKTEYLVNKMNTMSDNALTIKLADRVSNVSDFKTAPEKFRNKYGPATREMIKRVKPRNKNHKNLINKIDKIISEFGY